jgi:hypothetical protein
MEPDFDVDDYCQPYTVVGLLSYAIYQVGMGNDHALEATIAVIFDSKTEVRW